MIIVEQLREMDYHFFEGRDWPADQDPAELSAIGSRWEVERLKCCKVGD